MNAFAGIKDKASRSMDRAKSAVGIETRNSQDNNTLDELAEGCPQLTYQQRLIGFATCYILGYLITFMSFNFFIELVEGNPLPFVMLYTVGNIISLFSSMFLCGPKRQLKNMFDNKRKITTTVYLSTLFITIVVAFIPFEQTFKLIILVLLLLVQVCAATWYSLSYIPFARKAVLKCFRSSVNGDQV